MKRIFKTLVVTGMMLMPVLAFSADYPDWWTSCNVVTNDLATNDYAAANQGQVKWFATNAYNEFEANLPGGAGTNIENLVQGFTDTGNYYGVNIGQLKNIGKLFYDRLIEEGYTNAYPWTTVTTDDFDYAVANIGQLKNLFDFELTGDADDDSLPDWWEMHWWGDTNETESGDYDSDDLINSNEYVYGTCPTNSDTDADEMPDGWEVSNNLNPLLDDGALDSDGDGLSNVEEYKLGTNPQSGSDGIAMLESAREKIIAHWYMVYDTELVFTNTPGSAVDLIDMTNALHQLSGKFYEVVQ